jgi:hypothetical protein
MPAECEFPTGAASSLSELKSSIDSEVVPYCLELAFRTGELRSFLTTITQYGGLNAGPGIELRLETSEGDVQSFPVWQPNVESLSTLQGLRRSLLEQLESWLPESRLRWGENVHLVDPDNSQQ